MENAHAHHTSQIHTIRVLRPPTMVEIEIPPGQTRPLPPSHRPPHSHAARLAMARRAGASAYI
eukprot:2350566-Prymnesium_polylepis.1